MCGGVTRVGGAGHHGGEKLPTFATAGAVLL